MEIPETDKIAMGTRYNKLGKEVVDTLYAWFITVEIMEEISKKYGGAIRKLSKN